MNRLTFIRRLLYPLRNFSLFRNNSSAGQSSVQDGFYVDLNSERNNVWSKRFTVRDFHPKSLPQVDYDEILNGEVEDFSPDCWLDGHIHRFADANNIHRVLSNGHAYFSSPENTNSDLTSSGSGSDSDSPLVGNCRRNILVDLFVPISEPPPYLEGPPPSYEEAVSTTLCNNQDSVNEARGTDWILQEGPRSWILQEGRRSTFFDNMDDPHSQHEGRGSAWMY